MTRSGAFAIGLAAMLGMTAGAGFVARAHAEVVDLVCISAFGNPWPGSEHVSIDMDASTATQWMTRRAPEAPSSVPATITDDQVKFSISGSMPGHGADYTLNRQTGRLKVYSYDIELERSYSCKRVTAREAPVF